MKCPFLTLLLLFSLIACNTNSPTKEPKEEANNLYSTEADDKEMNDAIASARNTIEQFDKALQSNNFDTSTFALKIKFPTSNGGAEHIWATSIVIRDGNYFGIVDNLPELTTKVRLGDRIELNKENITDWMYSDKGILCGGYTIRLIRSRMTKDEQNKFDLDFPFRIKN